MKLSIIDIITAFSVLSVCASVFYLQFSLKGRDSMDGNISQTCDPNCYYTGWKFIIFDYNSLYTEQIAQLFAVCLEILVYGSVTILSRGPF